MILETSVIMLILVLSGYIGFVDHHHRSPLKMAEIRSAIEIAMEKADRLGLPTKEELETEKWLDCGHRIGVQGVRGE